MATEAHELLVLLPGVGEGGELAFELAPGTDVAALDAALVEAVTTRGVVRVPHSDGETALAGSNVLGWRFAPRRARRIGFTPQPAAAVASRTG